MQKKLILPVAVLGLAMISTACTPNNNQGISPNTDHVNRTGYRDNINYPNRVSYNGYMNRTGYNQYGYNGTNLNGPNVNGPTYPGGRTDLNNRTGWNRTGTSFNGATNRNPNLMPTNLNAHADRIANIAAGVKGVDSATTFIIGKTAYVGLDIDHRVNRNTDIGRIENEVVLALNKAMPRYDIRVTSDKGFFRRIGAVNTGVRNTRNGGNVDFLQRNGSNMTR